MPLKTTKISSSEKQNSPQIIKHFRADSTIDTIDEDILFDLPKSEEHSATARKIDVLFDTLTVQENNSFPVDSELNEIFIVSESENFNPSSAPLYKSGWQYSQLVKEFRFD